jgi:putative drug exporter of the RND superfamily
VVQERISAEKLAQGHFILMTVVPRSDPESAAASKLIHQLGEMKVSSLKPSITGQTALRVDILDRIYHGLPFMMLFIITITYFVLFSAFKSVLIHLKRC